MARSAFVLVFAAGLGLAACTTPEGYPDNRANSALIGAAGGAMIGQAIGGDSRSTLIGTAAGAGLGALAGTDADCQQNPRYCRL